MARYDVTLGVDKAARPTSRKMSVRVTALSPLSAAIAAEQIGDSRLPDPAMYCHAMHVRPVAMPVRAMAMPLAA